MLWIFLVFMNLVLIIALWNYFKENFYNLFMEPSTNHFLLLLSLTHYYLYNYSVVFTLYIKVYLFKEFSDTLWFLCLPIYSILVQFYFLLKLLTIFMALSIINASYILNYLLLITHEIILAFNFNSMNLHTLNWDSVFNYQNSVYFNNTLNSLSSLQHLFIILTIFLTPFALFSNWNDLKYKIYNIKAFLIILLSLVLILIICFSTYNLFVFILMFEASTIPLFLLISLFGHRAKKFRAAWYLFIYTLLGSIFLLGSAVLIYAQYQTFNLFEIFFNYQFKYLSEERFKLIWLGLFLGFAIKVPIAPFHMWLPEAHVEAPTSGSILLAGILLKLGGFGIIFFMLPFFNNNYFLPLVYTLCVISMFYSSIILFRETHLKKIIAYSSIVHMNIGILGLFSNSLVGIVGGIFMMFSHGFISGGLFFCAGIIYNRFKTYDITVIKNLSTSMPKFSLFIILLIFGNMGLPLTSGFIGEFLVLVGVFQHSYFISICILLILLLNTIYNIILLTRILYGNLLLPSFFYNKVYSNQLVFKPHWRLITVVQDITRIEFFSLFILTFYSIFFGIFPNYLLYSFYTDNFLFLL